MRDGHSNLALASYLTRSLTILVGPALGVVSLGLPKEPPVHDKSGQGFGPAVARSTRSPLLDDAGRAHAVRSIMAAFRPAAPALAPFYKTPAPGARRAALYKTRRPSA